MRRQLGFTLVETVVTVAIAALLMFAVVPDIAAWMRNSQVRNATESVLQGLQRARNEAVRRNTSVRFTLVSLSDPKVMDASCAASSTSGSWVVSLANPVGKCDQPSTVDPFIVDSHAVGDGGRNAIVSAFQADGTTAATTVTFDAFGRVTSPNPIGRIDVSFQGGAQQYRPLRILLSTNGSIRSCDPNVSSTDDPRVCPAN